MALFDSEERELLERTLPALQRFLNARERSRGEVLRQLKQKRICSPEEAERVAAHLEDSGLVDDLRFARHRAWYRLENGYGPRYIESDLFQHAVGRETIRQALEELPEDDVIAAARRALARKRKSAPQAEEPEERQKLMAALQRRGFNGSQIRAAFALRPAE